MVFLWFSYGFPMVSHYQRVYQRSICRAYTNVNRLGGSAVGLDAMKKWDRFLAVAWAAMETLLVMSKQP